MDSLLGCRVRAPCGCAEDLQVDELLANWGVNVSEAYSVFSAKVGFEESKVLSVQGADGLLHPISQIEFVDRGI